MAVAITTRDNPYSPFDQFDKWLKWDMDRGYNTTMLLARLAPTHPSFGDSTNEKILEETIDQIIEDLPNIPYLKVVG